MNLDDLFDQYPRLESDRLILRRLTFDDAKDIYEYASNPVVSEKVTWNTHKTIHDSMDYIRYAERRYSIKESLDWVLQLKKTGKVIGTCGYNEIKPQHSRVEIGYVLSQEYWNQGFMTEAVKEVIRFSFLEVQINRITARCESNNYASERVMLKNNMTYEGTLRQFIYVKNRFWDVKFYSILKKEFQL